ncbi:MAG: F0F1 ATP synthase subunit B' [Inquilinus sp.]|nr:F0F1 ATP synthase subunit B' [Inquilinus sp.]
MPQFDPQYFASQIFWLAVSFAILYWLMARFVLPRIAEVLEERSERIADDLEKAETLKTEAEAVIEAYEAALAKARGEASGLLAKAAQEIAEVSAQRQAEFAAALAKKTQAAEDRIATAKQEATAQVRDIAVDAARAITDRLVGAAPDEAAAAAEVDTALKGTG